MSDENAPVNVVVYTIAGKVAYRNLIPEHCNGLAVQLIPSELLLHSGCYMERVDIGGKIFNGKVFINK